MKMKNIIGTCFSLLFVLNVHTQVSPLEQSDMPVVDQVYSFYTSANNIDFNTTGPNTIWDYSDISVGGIVTDSFNSPSSAPFVYQLVFNNFLFPANNSTHAQPGIQFNLPASFGFTITDVINFYKNSPGAFTQLGFGATINNIPTPIIFSNKDEIYQFPLNYGDVDTSDYYYEIDIPTVGFWKQKGVRVNNADGWGTLKLPYLQEFEVLRVKTKLVTTDSLRADQLGFTIPVTRTTYEYKFFAEGSKVPVLQINTQPLLLNFGPETVISVRFNYTEPQYAENNEQLQEKFRIYPNPSISMIYMNYPSQWVDPHFSMINSEGRIVMTGTVAGAINISRLSSGIYTIIVDSDGQQLAVERWVKE